MNFTIECSGTIVTNLSKTEKYMNFLLGPEITEIGKDVCKGCSVEVLNMSLTHIEIIGYTAFAYCTKLREVVFPETLVSIRDNAFHATILTDIFIPANVKNMTGFAWNQISTLKCFTLDPKNQNFNVVNGCLFDSTNKILLRATNNITSCSDIPLFHDITTIGEFALTSIPMTSFIADKNLNFVESKAFHAMFQITLIDLTYSNITYLPEQLVWGNRALKTFICPFSLEIIERNAFYVMDGLQEIIIYSHLTHLSEAFLYNCSAITKIYYYGLSNFSDVNMVSGSTNIKNIHVYVTKLY